jgi:hypothetical protein
MGDDDMSTRVVNVRGRMETLMNEGPFVYIGRGSIWGNPFTHIYADGARTMTGGLTLVGSREEAIEKYEAWIKTQPELLAQLPTLRGKTLGCYCKPLACHGDILARMADEC